MDVVIAKTSMKPKPGDDLPVVHIGSTWHTKLQVDAGCFLFKWPEVNPHVMS